MASCARKERYCFGWRFAHPFALNSGAPIEYAHSILHVSDHIPQLLPRATRDPQTHIYVMIWSYPILRAIPAIHERNALREVLPQRVGKLPLISSIALSLIPHTHTI